MGNYPRGAQQHQPAQPLIMMEKCCFALIRIAFRCVTLICDSLSALSPEHPCLCINRLGLSGQQVETIVALTARGPLLELACNALWPRLLLEIPCLCQHATGGAYRPFVYGVTVTAVWS